MFDRIRQVVRAEWSARTHDADVDDAAWAEVEAALATPGAENRAPAAEPGAAQDSAGHVLTPESAYRVLDLTPGADLAAVRASHERLTRHYYPRTLSTDVAQAAAAQKLLGAMTEACELLERHLLPVAPHRADVAP